VVCVTDDDTVSTGRSRAAGRERPQESPHGVVQAVVDSARRPSDWTSFEPGIARNGVGWHDHIRNADFSRSHALEARQGTAGTSVRRSGSSRNSKSKSGLRVLDDGIRVDRLHNCRRTAHGLEE
jgi:hypothetical protein